MNESKRAWWENECKRCMESKYRQEREYGSYLDRWLHSHESVDGAPYEIRMASREPMSFIVYMYE